MEYKIELISISLFDEEVYTEYSENILVENENDILDEASDIAFDHVGDTLENWKQEENSSYEYFFTYKDNNTCNKYQLRIELENKN